MRHYCPGCSVTIYGPPPVTLPLVSLTCKHCGGAAYEKGQLVRERDKRICVSCGVCAICGSAHTVRVRPQGIAL